MKFLCIAAAFAAVSLVRAAIVPANVTEPDGCVKGSSKLVSSTDIDGKPYTVHTCTPKAGTTERRDDTFTLLEKRNYDLCGAPCTTYCNSGSGGPNPNDCTALANADANSGTFIVPPGTATYWTYASCRVWVTNELSPAQDIVYCYDWNNWAGVVNYLAWNCQGTTGDNGGSCHFYDSTAISWVLVETA